LIVRRLVVDDWRANCYIVGSESSRQGFIIDPGDEANAILAAVKESGLKIQLLAATHGHIDHIGAIGSLKKALDVPVLIHRSDSTALQGDGRFFWGRTFSPPIHADRLLEDGDIITVADLKFTVINTPGHTYGCVCFYGEGALFTGDTLFRHSIGSSGIGTGTRGQLMQSIYDKLLVLPPETVIYPGHGSPSTIAEEKANNPYLTRRY
jgi:hydroxyacylglutathione hydrolase